MAPIYLDAFFIVLSLICLVIELVSVAPRRVNLLLLAAIFYVTSELIAPLNAIITR